MGQDSGCEGGEDSPLVTPVRTRAFASPAAPDQVSPLPRAE